MSRFSPGDVVIHRDSPSRPEVVTKTLVLGDAEFVATVDGIGRYAGHYHHTGMRQVLARPRDQTRYGR